MKPRGITEPPRVVFQTPWFKVSAEAIPGSPQPHYSIHAPDFATIVAVDAQGRLLLVRQYRPAQGSTTLELPCGHVEPGDTPEQTARKELLEETGYSAESFELLATLAPSTSRFTNRMWCFFAAQARPCPGARVEDGLEPVLYGKGIRELVAEENFLGAGNYAALLVAVVRGRLHL